ncbi:MAG: hypothetical protein JWN48_995 [Myxococcaceae bacterium]|nr:hypothetical protein [Myxococcaceae bacterium]
MVQDPGGASFPPSEAPRDLSLTLSFAHAPPDDAAHALLLVRGMFGAPFLGRFVGMRQSSALKQRTIPIELARAARSLTVRVDSAALAPGARYSLAWLSTGETLAYPLRIAEGPSQGARLVESWPSQDATHVPAQLAHALLRFDGFLEGEPAAHVSLRDAADAPLDARVTRERCSLRGLPEGDCVWLEPSVQLTAGAPYRLVLAPGLRTVTGAPILPAEVTFEVASASLAVPLALRETRCAPDESPQEGACVRVDDRSLFVRGTLSEAALVTLVTAAPDALHSAATLSYANTFALRIALPEAATSALLRVSDLAGRHLELALSSTVERDLARLSIDEVRADPVGKEPAQEYVELLNFGSTPVSLMGFTLSTDALVRGRSVLGSAGLASEPSADLHARLDGESLAPGERALLVGSEFDPRDAADGALPGGLRLIYLDGALSLSNDGELLFLRDPQGRRVAAARTFPGLVEGQCTARFHGDELANADLRSDDASAFELDPSGGCTPGSATFPEP